MFPPDREHAEPTYEETRSGRTGHTEVVLVVFDPNKVPYEKLLKTFWESHNPTQGMRQGNDVGTQYRSAIYTHSDAQKVAADASKALYQKALAAKGLGAITTEIAPAGEFYFAEDYHQQYLAKNPAGYCGLGGTSVSCPIGVGVSASASSGFAAPLPLAGEVDLHRRCKAGEGSFLWGRVLLRRHPLP